MYNTAAVSADKSQKRTPLIPPSPLSPSTIILWKKWHRLQILNIFQGLYQDLPIFLHRSHPPPFLLSLYLPISPSHLVLSLSPQKPWQPDHLCLLVSIKSEISAFVNISFVVCPWCTADLSSVSWHFGRNAEAAVSLIRPVAGIMMADTTRRLRSPPTWY